MSNDAVAALLNTANPLKPASTAPVLQSLPVAVDSHTPTMGSGALFGLLSPAAKAFPKPPSPPPQAAALGAAGWWIRSRPPAGQSTATLAVLPFKPLATESRDELLEVGMADSLIARLSTVPGLVVRSTGSVQRYAGPMQDPVRAARELEVTWIVDGSLQRRGDLVRATARLLHAADGVAAWSGGFDEKFTSVFDVQDQISNLVTQALLPVLRVGLGTPARLADIGGTRDMDAYQLYLAARWRAQGGRADEVDKGVALLNQALSVDPAYAMAWVELAQVGPSAQAVEFRWFGCRGVRAGERCLEACARAGPQSGGGSRGSRLQPLLVRLRLGGRRACISSRVDHQPEHGHCALGPGTAAPEPRPPRRRVRPFADSAITRPDVPGLQHRGSKPFDGKRSTRRSPNSAEPLARYFSGSLAYPSRSGLDAHVRCATGTRHCLDPARGGAVRCHHPVLVGAGRAIGAPWRNRRGSIDPEPALDRIEVALRHPDFNCIVACGAG